uniref:Uncharacterized protein n=1 Tax=Rhipicephalus appendiculatus TaxID=34631 RepID=A0A131YBQ6_RHIAP
MCVLLLALGLLALGSNLGCEAHLLGTGDFRNPLDPFNVLDDIFKNIPGLGSAVGGPHAGARPVPHVPHQPLPPHGGGGSGFPIRPDNYPPDVGPQQPHGNSPGTGPVPPQPGSGGGGPAVPQGPVIPSRPTNPSGPVVPSGPAVPPTPVNKPGKRPAPGGGSNPPGEGSDDGAPCDECEPGDNDSYIHLIDPRRGKN